MLPAFCSNLLPDERLAPLGSALADFGRGLRAELGWSQIGVDLRLGSAAIVDWLDNPRHGQAFRNQLDDAGLVVTTINGFPLDPFQVASVKDGAYRPDWTEPRRLAHSLALIDIVLALCDDEFCTISTLPGSYRPWGPAHNDESLITDNLNAWAEAAATRSRSVVLAIEPEPWCTFGSCAELAAFARRHQLSAEGLASCFDTCHASVEFEDQAGAVADLVAAGLPPLKVQYSAAPELPAGGDRQALAAMDEIRFLHQTALRTENGDIHRIADLDAMAELPDLPGVCRSHFHIPLHRKPAAPLLSTEPDSRRGLDAARTAGARHVSVETYTWSVLSDSSVDTVRGTAAELDHLDRLLREAAPKALEP